ncbi:MAG: hypothetical protein ABI837_11015 [Acidobacteriota bacterium]
MKQDFVLPRRLLAIMALTAAAQLWLAHRYFGFLTGDDVEVLGEAFRYIGYHYTAWDIRNVFIPDFVAAPPIVVGHFFGVTNVAVLIELATLPFVAVSVATIWLTWRLALRWTSDERVAIVAAILFASHWLPLAFGSTVYPRTIATFCVVAAALLISRRPFGAGLLMGVAFADRFSESVFLLPLMVLVMLGGERSLRAGEDGNREVPKHLPAKALLWLIAGALLSVAVLCGWYDFVTWGTPFSSVVKFAQLTLLAPDFASRVKYQAPWWYLANLLHWCAPPMMILLAFCRDRRPWLFIAAALVVLAGIRHKELRYLQAMIPFLAIAAAAGFVRIRRSSLAIALLAASVVWNAWGVRMLQKKSMPAVMAARALAADRSVNTVVMSQLWAYGDRLYFTERVAPRDVGEPPVALAAILNGADTAALYETDLDDPTILPALHDAGFERRATYRDGRARSVVVFRK